MDWIIQLFGRLHPLVVHLPIGILFLAFIFECLSRFQAFKNLDSAVQPSLGIGAIFAIASVISGLFLSGEGGYSDTLLQKHQNLGIVTTVFAVVLFFLRERFARFSANPKKLKSIRILLFIPLMTVLSFTGHLGGSMTHGEDYLFEFLAEDKASDPMARLKTIANTGEAILYRDVIAPILNSKCYSCHSSKKRKGELRLDRIELITQGGKHGPVIEAGIPDSSSLYSRLILPLEDEDHMPPKDSPQLSSAEIALIQSWVEEGADFDKKVNGFSHADKIEKYLTTLIARLDQVPLIPAEEIPAADAKALDVLGEKGILVLPVGRESNYVSVSFVNARSATDAELELLLSLKKQLLWLDLGRTKITDEGLRSVAQLTALRQLRLEYTMISDNGIKNLASLPELNYLNLAGTKITNEGLAFLSELKKIKNIFVYQTGVTAKGLREFSLRLPNARVDTGGYVLPKLPSDTIVFKRKI